MKTVAPKLWTQYGVRGGVAGLLNDSIETGAADLKYLACARLVPIHAQQHTLNVPSLYISQGCQHIVPISTTRHYGLHGFGKISDVYGVRRRHHASAPQDVFEFANISGPRMA